LDGILGITDELDVMRVEVRIDGNVHAIAGAVADQTMRDRNRRLIGIHLCSRRSGQAAIIEGDMVQADQRGREGCPDSGQAPT
jgi:hypothetical protein